MVTSKAGEIAMHEDIVDINNVCSIHLTIWVFQVNSHYMIF